jgi:hypothetical protein
MSDPSLPPGQPTAEGRFRFHPAVIAVVLIVLAAVGALTAFKTEPVWLWAVPILVPILGGIMAAAGHHPAVKTRRFLRAFAIVLGVELAVGLIAFGICLVILTQEGVI